MRESDCKDEPATPAIATPVLGAARTPWQRPALHVCDEGPEFKRGVGTDNGIYS